MDKLIQLVAKYKKIKLNGVFQNGFTINDELEITSTHRVIKIEKYLTRYKFYMNSETRILTEEQLREVFNHFVTKKITKVSTY